MPFLKPRIGKRKDNSTSKKLPLSDSKTDTKTNKFTNGSIKITVPQDQKFLLKDVTDKEIVTFSLLTSRLILSLDEIVRNSDVLPHFMTFLDKSEQGHLLRFILDAESFYASAKSRCHSGDVQMKIDKLKITTSENVDDTNVRRRSYCEDGGWWDRETKLSNNSLGDSRRDYPVTYNDGSLDLKQSLADASVISSCDKQESIENRSPDFKVTISQSDVLKNESFHDKLHNSISKDALHIYTSYIAPNSLHLLPLPSNHQSEALDMMCREDNTVNIDCFKKCQEYVFDLLKNEHFHQFGNSSDNVKYQIELLTSGEVCLADILYNENAFFYFMEYMEQENASPLVQFVSMVDNFQQQFESDRSNFNTAEVQNDAIVIYDRYLSLQATQPLGFSDRIRLNVESDICNEDGPKYDSFSVPRCMALKCIKEEYFDGFMKSDLFYKYLTELVSSVQRLENTNRSHLGHKKTGSTTSSELSQGSQSPFADGSSARNTLLASGQKELNRSFSSLSFDLSMDDEFVNPDNLWKRNNAGPLKLGQVDEMGQFISFLQPHPSSGKKKASRIFRKNQEKLKEEEQMALRIAEVIVNDVTRVTQSDGRHYSRVESDSVT